MGQVYRFRGLFHRAEYELLEEGVAITERKFGAYSRAQVPYSLIPAQASTVTLVSKGWLWAMIVFALLFTTVLVSTLSGADVEPAAPVVWGTMLALSLGMYLASRKAAEVFLHERESLVIFYRRREPELSAFLEQLQARKLAHLERLMTRRVAEVSGEEASRYLIAVRECGLIDEQGYQRLRAALTRALEHRPFGFN